MRIRHWLTKSIVLCIGLVISAAGLAAEEFSGISVVEGVAIKNGNRAEAIFYYENNWLRFRKEALRLGYIDSFEMIVSVDVEDDAGIVLITHFQSEAQFNEVEENFDKIMRDSDLRFLNEVQPGEFRDSVFVVTGKRIDIS